MANTTTLHPTGANLKQTMRAMRAVACLLLTLYLVTLTALFHIAREQNTEAAERTRFFASKALEGQQTRLSTALNDYAFWGDAYGSLHNRIDLDWAYTRENMGPALYRDFTFEGVFVVGPQDRTVYAVINGELQDIQADQWLQNDLLAMLADARGGAEGEVPSIHSMLLDGEPALVAAAALTPGGDATQPLQAGPESVVLFVDRLTPAKLGILGEAFGLEHLRQADATTVDDDVLVLDTYDGAGFALTWDTPRPGSTMLIVMLPVVGLLGAVLALIALAIMRRAGQAARQMDLSYRSLTDTRNALISSEARFRDVAEASSDWIWETDSQLRLTYLSERFHEVTGHLPANWIGQPIDQFLRHTEDLCSLLNNHALVAGESRSNQCTYHDHKGRQRICRISLRRIVSPESSHAVVTTGFRGTANDVTDEMEARARIEHLSHDALTGLPNRHRLREFLDGKLVATPTPEAPLVMMSLDLDRFKPVNDSYGHAAGDRVLSEVSTRMRDCLRGDDLVARIGGDEFVLIISNLASKIEIDRLCERLITAIEQPFHFGGHRIFISASIGISLAPADGIDAEDLLRHADLALYAAKNAGRNTWRFYASDMNARLTDQRRTEDYLRRAVRNKSLSLVMQPRYAFSTGNVSGVEALVRWVHPEKGMLMPSEFVRMAEATGEITGLSDWVLHRACTEAVSWTTDTAVSVNLSPADFQGGELVSRVQRALSATGLAPELLELELVEGVLMEDPEQILKTMQALRHIGVRLTLDDFGTGYSSLSYLRRFPFSGLKIDASVVAELDSSQSCRTIFQSVVNMGKALGMTVTAEGVESAAQLDLVRALGCDEAQGYFLGHPIMPARLWDKLESQSRYTSLKADA